MDQSSGHLFTGTGFAIDQDATAGGSDLDGLLLASPANPTGSMLNREELAALLDYCRDRNIRFISDEIYHGITYGEPAISALEFDAQALVINCFSKYFSMSG